MTCILISERIMRDKIARGVQKGGGAWGHPGTNPPAPERDGSREPARQHSPRKRKKEEERGGMGKNHKEGIQGERREV